MEEMKDLFENNNFTEDYKIDEKSDDFNNIQDMNINTTVDYN